MSGKIYETVQGTGKLLKIWEQVGTHWLHEPVEVSHMMDRKVHVAASRRIEGGVFLNITGGGGAVHLTPEQLDDLVTILAFIKKVNDEYES